ncbi:MAG TPA: hypothetical protein VJS16_03545 [Gammaproteobacteria bacterium]|nr:hypothetical protein [Gammaproteobacteria bacterium]
MIDFYLLRTPVRIEFRSGENPYARQRKKLTPRKARIARRQRRIRKTRKS